MGEMEGKVRTNNDMKTDAKILLGRILQRLIDTGYCQVDGYNIFELIDYSHNRITVGRENGKDTHIYFDKILQVIEEYQMKPGDYDTGPSKTREYGITYVNSPIWSMVHLLDKSDFEN